MRRAERLFALVQLLRAKRVSTAQTLADKLQVSERTVYRDVQDLQRSGVPILGEAGVGYALDKSFDVPPIMFDSSELQALVIGARMLNAWGDPAMADAAERALSKINSVLPTSKRDTMERTPIFAPNFHVSPEIGQHFALLRGAISERRFCQFAYQDRRDRASTRNVRPVALHFWGDCWTLAAWCELRLDFRNFRLDKMAELTVSKETFNDEVGKRLLDFYRKLGLK
jgi:predicted DNA-binding transcriptional regulator YafY